MNLERCYLLGEAASNAAPKPHQPHIALVDRPPGAVNTFVGIGIVLSVIEDSFHPADKLDTVRDRIQALNLSEELLEDVRRGIVHLILDGYLELDTTDYSVTFTRPDSDQYKHALSMDS